MPIADATSLLDPRALGELDLAVEAALETGDATGLPVIGVGEVSTVLA